MCHLYSLRACKNFNVILIKGNFSTAVIAAKSPVRHISPSGLLALLCRCQWNYPTREFCQATAVKLVIFFFPDSLLLSICDLEKKSVRKSGTIKYELPATNEICFKITTKRQKEKKQLLAIFAASHFCLLQPRVQSACMHQNKINLHTVYHLDISCVCNICRGHVTYIQYVYQSKRNSKWIVFFSHYFNFSPVQGAKCSISFNVWPQ